MHKHELKMLIERNIVIMNRDICYVLKRPTQNQLARSEEATNREQRQEVWVGMGPFSHTSPKL